MIKNTLYWTLVDLDDLAWTESLIKYDSLDAVKDRVLYLTHMVDPNKTILDQTNSFTARGAQVQFKPLKFGNWRAVEKLLFGGSNIVDLNDWYTIIRLAN